MIYLFVVAHPDDEVLGAGGMIWRATQKEDQAHVCILSGEVEAREHRPSLDKLASDIYESTTSLGVTSVRKGSFPNIAFNTQPHRELVQFVETAILETCANVVVTHHPGDTNNDHLHTSLACQAAIRIFQRKEHTIALKELLFMEVPSATEWSVNHALRTFTPNTFVELQEDGLSAKLNALSMYRGVMRPFPHPRSEEAIRGLAAYRGAQSGLHYAEAFECVFRRIN